MSIPSRHLASGVMQGEVLVANIAANSIRDSETAYALRDELNALIDANRTKHLIIDARNVESIGSIGFLAFLSVRRHLIGGRIVLFGLMPIVNEAFRACQLISSDASKAAPFETADSLDSAIAKLADAH